MAEVNRLVDALALFLTGGASNRDPALSLGGAVSTTRVRGLGALIDGAGLIPGIRIDNAFPASGEGSAELKVDPAGSLIFTPPGASAGAAVAIAAGESKIVAGTDANKALRVFRESGLRFTGLMKIKLVFSLNGVFGQASLSNADRLAGRTTYRAILLHAPSRYPVAAIKLWLPPIACSQATFSLATETTLTSAIQSVANETTAPAGLTWSEPRTEATALRVPPVGAGRYMGLWIRRVVPGGATVTPRENVQLAMSYRGV